jgi:N-acetylneuraminate synthase
MSERFRIADCAVGPGEPCFVIAEAGVNHNGSVEIARAMVDAAAAAGANAIKFQTFDADRLAAKTARKAEYQRAATGDAGSQHAMLRALELSEPAHRDLQAYCREKGILFLSTPFDEQSADFLESIGVPAYKISSGDLTNHPLLAHVGRKGKPVILSTGMATLDEVAEAVAAIKEAAEDFALLQCVSNYPADPRGVNLRVMRTYADRFGVPVGYSDHTLGIAVPIAAVGLGAAIIEKHFTLDVAMAGPDHRASLEPRELADMIASIRIVESALGDGVKAPLPSELPISDVARKSLHWRRSAGAGQKVAASDIIALRPGTGLPPSSLKDCVGRTLARDASAGEPVSMDMFAARGKER